jgi:hypothetical protein
LNDNEKIFILNGILDTINIILKIKNINTNNYMKIYDDYAELVDHVKYNMETNKNIHSINQHAKQWQNTFINIICERINYFNMHILSNIFEHISKFNWEYNINEIMQNEFKQNNDTTVKKMCSTVSTQYINKINFLFKSLTSKIKLLENYKMNISEIIKKYQNNSKNNLISYKQNTTKSNFLIKKLFKLYLPVKQPHYDYMFSNLTENNDKIIYGDNKVITITESNIKSTIFYMDNSINFRCPIRWIKTYAPNIGSEDKTDPNHMFSFALDNILENITCYQQTANDCYHNNKKNILFYFNGLLEYDGEVQTGCYEYFINSYGTLFHRMFRPWTTLPDNIKQIIK